MRIRLGVEKNCHKITISVGKLNRTQRNTVMIIILLRIIIGNNNNNDNNG